MDVISTAFKYFSIIENTGFNTDIVKQLGHTLSFRKTVFCVLRLTRLWNAPV